MGRRGPLFGRSCTALARYRALKRKGGGRHAEQERCTALARYRALKLKTSQTSQRVLHRTRAIPR